MNLGPRVGAWLRRGRVGLWYHPDYAALGLSSTSRVEHVQADRGERVVGRLLQEGLVRAKDVRTPPIASIGQLRRFHSLGWLERIGEPETLGRVFGLEPGAVDADVILAFARRATGGTISALHEAAFRRLSVAINLGGGLHHAEPEQGSGFCVINDIGVAIADLRASGYRGRVAIVDLDFHQGNGNTVAFADDPTVFVYSIHGAVWTHVDPGDSEIHLTGPVNDRRYLATLRTTLETALRRFRPDVVVYIAGTDVLAGDRLGSFWLTLRGTLERDRHVYQVVRSLGVSLCVTLGGGYGRLAWRSDLQLTRALVSGFWRVDARSPPSMRARYAHIAATLDPRELQQDPIGDLKLTEEDLFGALNPHAGTGRFLDYYSRHGIELVFERYGIFAKIRSYGFRDVELEIDPKDPGRQMIRLKGRRPPDKERMVLLELVARRSFFPSPVDGLERLEVLYLEWLLLQDPSRSFSLSRPPLPGQDHPGLGLARAMQEVLRQAAFRLGLHGIADRPSHYHNALFCEQEWRFLDPATEGLFRAMRAVLAGRDLYEATRIVEDGRLALADGQTVWWTTDTHIHPLEPHLKAYFEEEGYVEPARRAKARWLDAGLHVTPSPAPPGTSPSAVGAETPDKDAPGSVVLLSAAHR